MSFYIGQRVKKVRGGVNEGLTGTVAGTDYGCPFGLTLAVHVDSSCTVHRILGKSHVIRAGEIAWGKHENFEPILPPGLESPAEIAALYEPEDAIA